MYKTSWYNVRENDTFEKRQVHSVYQGTQSLSFLGPKICDLVPAELKQSESIDAFKLKIKKWIPFKCPCRLCTYVVCNLHTTRSISLRKYDHK